MNPQNCIKHRLAIKKQLQSHLTWSLPPQSQGRNVPQLMNNNIEERKAQESKISW